MNPHYPAVAIRAGHRCEYCHAPEAVFNFPFEVEHIVPLARHGEDADHNLALACRACNVCKASSVDHEDPLTGTVVSLYDPRQAVWDQHFRLDSHTGKLTGRTPIGRATIACLKMNSPAQLVARRLWIQLGLIR